MIICQICNGSGEGRHDGQICYQCRGEGGWPDTGIPEDWPIIDYPEFEKD